MLHVDYLDYRLSRMTASFFNNVERNFLYFQLSLNSVSMELNFSRTKKNSVYLNKETMMNLKN